MPELPDIEVYLDAFRERLLGKTVRTLKVLRPFVVRSYDPHIDQWKGRTITSLSRLGKRVVFSSDDDAHLVVHLMIAGRFKYGPPALKANARTGLFRFEVDDGCVLLTEASKKRRASVHLVASSDDLRGLDPGGIEPLKATAKAFAAVLRRKNHTLKRALTDPAILSGIGNAFSDEILHEAQLSPVTWTSRLTDEDMSQLQRSTKTVLKKWLKILRKERGSDFPEKVTAFRPQMAVHGKYRSPCPRCDGEVQRIVRGKSEVNYCPTCQTKGKLLKDRALSRLLRGDWPKTMTELEERRAQPLE